MPHATHEAAARLSRAWWSRGPLAYALLPIATLFGLLAALRRQIYRLGWWHVERLPAPVIVVGNLTVGGAGKTPTVIAVVSRLRERGWQPGIISRGYGRSSDAVMEVQPGTDAALCGDEPLLLRLRTGAPTVVGRDRVAAARELLHRHPRVNVIVSDDGLQHLRLPREVQILVFDERGVGNGWLLPAGPLREPMPTRVPQRTLVLYNAARPSTALPGHAAKRRLAGAVSLDAWWAGQHASTSMLNDLAQRPLLAAAGLASPERFFDMLRAAGLGFTPLPLPDHHDFSALPWPSHVADVIVTEKDAVKLRPDRVGGTRVWVAPLDFELDERFEHELLAWLPAPNSRNTDG